MSKWTQKWLSSLLIQVQIKGKILRLQVYWLQITMDSWTSLAVGFSLLLSFYAF